MGLKVTDWEKEMFQRKKQLDASGILNKSLLHSFSFYDNNDSGELISFLSKLYSKKNSHDDKYKNIILIIFYILRLY